MLRVSAFFIQRWLTLDNVLFLLGITRPLLARVLVSDERRRYLSVQKFRTVGAYTKDVRQLPCWVIRPAVTWSMAVVLVVVTFLTILRAALNRSGVYLLLKA